MPKQKAYALGIDLGGTKTLAAVILQPLKRSLRGRRDDNVAIAVAVHVDRGGPLAGLCRRKVNSSE